LPACAHRAADDEKAAVKKTVAGVKNDSSGSLARNGFNEW
jgi:hypothetical protein